MHATLRAVRRTHGMRAGLFWVASGVGVLYAFERRPLSHWLVNGGYHTVAYTMMGAILGAWR